MDLGTLSRTLVGLSNQALSYSRDVVKNDYLHKFYEESLMPEERYNAVKEFQDYKAQVVFMERSYLKAWKIFSQESAKLLPSIKELVEADKGILGCQLQGLTALTACKFDEPELRDQIVQNCLNLMENPKVKVSVQDSLAGLMGLAQSATINDKSKELAQKLSKKILLKHLSFTEQVDALWALAALQQYESPVMLQLVQLFNKLTFERIDHDIRF